MSHVALSPLSEVQALLELPDHAAKDHPRVVSSSVWSGSGGQIIVFFTFSSRVTKNCKGFPLGVASDGLAEKKYTLFYGCSCPAHIFSQKEQERSLIQILLCPWFIVCFMLFCTCSVFELPEKYIFWWKLLESKTQNSFPGFHVFPNFTNALNFNVQNI